MIILLLIYKQTDTHVLHKVAASDSSVMKPKIEYNTITIENRLFQIPPQM